MKPALKAIWYSFVDMWLYVKRILAVDSYIKFDTIPGYLVVYMRHYGHGREKTIRIAVGNFDAAINYIDRQPFGHPVVFREKDNWVMVPNFFVVELRSQLIQARHALERSRNSTEVSGVVTVEPAVNTRSSKSLN